MKRIFTGVSMASIALGAPAQANLLGCTGNACTYIYPVMIPDGNFLCPGFRNNSDRPVKVTAGTFIGVIQGHESMHSFRCMGLVYEKSTAHFDDE